jgi:hypothetical protein
MPPQLVACEGLHFYRITEDSLHVFEASTRVPPPQLRGSATASHSARIEVGNPRNVIALGKNRVLVAGEKNTFRYQTGAKEAEPGTPLASGAPSFLWRDRKSDASFWVRALGEKKLHRYTWPSGAEPPAITAKLGHSVEPLSEFDARLCRHRTTRQSPGSMPTISSIGERTAVAWREKQSVIRSSPWRAC